MAGGLPEEATEVAKPLEDANAANSMAESMATAKYDVWQVEDDMLHQVCWQDICNRLRLDGDTRLQYLFHLFQERYEVRTPIDAFTEIPRFLGEYMVREFDYRGFILQLELAEESSVSDDSAFAAFMADNLSDHLVLAASLMLRLAATIAKAHDLQPCDWKDINDICSSAVQMLPACFRLHRGLPGALSVARASRFLPSDSHEVGLLRDGNPWNNEQDRENFVTVYSLPWERVEALTATDEKVASCFSGCLMVKEVNTVEEVSLVTLEAVQPTVTGSPPGPFPEKALVEGDSILWEVEQALGRLLVPGIMIEADWYEMQNQLCFMAAPISVFPSWAS